MRANVVDEDSRTGQSEGTGKDLYEQSTSNGDPYPRSADTIGWGRPAGNQTQERSGRVHDRKESEEDAIAAYCAQAMRNSGINEELQGYAYDTDDGKCYTDASWRHG